MNLFKIQAVSEALMLDKLNVAICNEDIATVKACIPRVRNLDAIDGNGGAPIHYAASVASMPIIRILLEAGASQHVTSSDELLAANIALANGDVLVGNMFGRRATRALESRQLPALDLHQHARSGNYDSMVEALKAGLDPNGLDENYRTALSLAAEHGHTSLVRLLLENQADPDIPTARGCTALMFAAMNNHTDLVSLLLSEGVSLNIQSDESAKFLFDLVFGDEASPLLDTFIMYSWRVVDTEAFETVFQRHSRRSPFLRYVDDNPEERKRSAFLLLESALGDLHPRKHLTFLRRLIYLWASKDLSAYMTDRFGVNTDLKLPRLRRKALQAKRFVYFRIVLATIFRDLLNPAIRSILKRPLPPSSHKVLQEVLFDPTKNSVWEDRRHVVLNRSQRRSQLELRPSKRKKHG